MEETPGPFGGQRRRRESSNVGPGCMRVVLRDLVGDCSIKYAVGIDWSRLRFPDGGG